MKIAYIAAGAAGMYCGNCLRDHALARSLRELGQDFLLVPTYTPLKTDLPQGSETASDELFFNGIRAWLEQKVAWFRKPRPVVDRLLGSRAVAGLLARMQFSTDPAKLGDLTVSMLEGESGHQRRELDPLIAWLAEDVRPDIVHISNALLIGMARRLRAELDVPVVCSLQSEDIFLLGLEPPWRDRAFSIIAERIAEVDALIAISEFYAGWCSEHFSIERDRLAVVPSGIPLEGHLVGTDRGELEAPVIGFFARMAPEKGLDTLCHAFIDLTRRPRFSKATLRVAGYLPNAQIPWVGRLRRTLRTVGLADRVEMLGSVDREQKLAFLSGLDVLSVPTRHPEPKGLFVLEALASGVPVVLPNHGVFPELVEDTGGGLLHTPDDPGDLADSWEELLTDPERHAQLARQGRESVESRYTAERMARDTLNVYKGVFREAPAGC